MSMTKPGSVRVDSEEDRRNPTNWIEFLAVVLGAVLSIWITGEQ